MTLAQWILRPIVRLVLKSGHETIPQSIGILEGYKFDTDLEQPALFSVPNTVSGNVNVVYWNDTTEIIDCQFLSQRNMLIKRIKTSGTTVAIGNIRLEI
jgi:hypothetical protein